MKKIGPLICAILLLTPVRNVLADNNIGLETKPRSLSANEAIVKPISSPSEVHSDPTVTREPTKLSPATNKLQLTELGTITIGGYRMPAIQGSKRISESDFELFIPECWSENRSWSRFYTFSLFLRNYNIIGMSEQTVVYLLGDDGKIQPADYKGGVSSITYWLGQEESVLLWKIHFDNGVVDSWRFVRGDNQSEPIKSPVTVAHPPRITRGSENGIWPEIFRK